MTAAERIAALADDNPAAARLALACSLAFRVEPALLRALRLLLPAADASAESDLWHSSLLTGRDVTAIVLDPLVAAQLRAQLREPDLLWLREPAAATIAAAHAGAHWSVRVEERIRYLDCVDPGGLGDQADGLLMAALGQLRREPNPAGIARWLLGAVGRLPEEIRFSQLARVSAAAAGLHVDGRAPDPQLLSATESASWLPWLGESLSTVSVPVAMRDGAVVISGPVSNDSLLLEIPRTDPLTLDVATGGGTRPLRQRVRFGLEDAVQVETGSPVVTLTTITGVSYQLTVDGTDDQAQAGLRFDAIKARLRPCLGRSREVAAVLDAIGGGSDRARGAWVGITGRPGQGASTVLVAVTDALRQRGWQVIEHFFDPGNLDRIGGSLRPGSRDAPEVVLASCLAQLDAAYPESTSVPEPDSSSSSSEGFTPSLLAERLSALAAAGQFHSRPLVIALDGLPAATTSFPDSETVNHRSALIDLPFPSAPPPGVTYLVSCENWADVRSWLENGDTRFVQDLDTADDAEVSAAMIDLARPALERAFGTSLNRTVVDELGELVDRNPGRLDRILRWIGRQPAGSLTLDQIPAILTTGWPRIRDGLREPLLGFDADLVLDLVRAADGLNTWADLEAAAGETAAGEADGIDETEAAERWFQFRFQFRRRLERQGVVLASTSPIVRLAVPEAADLLSDPTARGRGDVALGLNGERPAEFAATASPTRLAAAVRHELAIPDLTAATLLVTDPLVVRRRYVEDRAGLLADLDRVAAWHGDQATINDLRAALAHLVKRRVPASRLIPAVIDRLAERGSRIEGWEAVGPAPLRVTARYRADELQNAAGDRRLDGPALALVRRGEVEVVLASGVRAVGAGDVTPLLRGPMLGAVSEGDVIAGWTDQEVVSRKLAGLGHTRGGPLPWIPRHDDLVVVSPAGSVFMAHPEDCTVSVPLGPGPQPLTLVGHNARVTAVIELPGWFVTASADGTVRVWDAFSGAMIRVLSGHRSAVRQLAMLTGDTFVSAGDDGCVLFWELSTGRLSERWQAHDGAITALCTADDWVASKGHVVVAGSVDGRVAWRMPGRSGSTSQHHDPVLGVTLSRGLLASWADGVSFWDLAAEQGIPYSGHSFPGGVSDVMLSADTFTVLCGNGSVQERPLPSVSPATEAEAASFGCLVIDGGTVQAGFGTGLINGGLISVEPASSRAVLGSAAAGPRMETTVLSATPAQAVVTDAGFLIRTWAGSLILGSGEVLTGPQDRVDHLAGHRSGPLLLARGRRVDCHLGLRYLQAGSTAQSWEFGAEVTSLAVGADRSVGEDRSAVVGLRDGTVIWLPLLSGSTRERVLPGNGRPVTAVATVTSDPRTGAVAISGTDDGAIRWCRVDQPASPLASAQGGGAVTGIVVLNRWMVSACADGTLSLWHLPTVLDAEARPDLGGMMAAHQIEIGAPVVALAGDPTSGRVAARDANGSLWLLQLDPDSERSPDSGPRLWWEVRAGAANEDRGALLLDDEQKVDVLAIAAPQWRQLEVPWRLTAEAPFRFAVREPADPAQPVAVIVQGRGVPGYLRTVPVPNRSSFDATDLPA